MRFLIAYITEIIFEFLIGRVCVKGKILLANTAFCGFNNCVVRVNRLEIYTVVLDLQSRDFVSQPNDMSPTLLLLILVCALLAGHRCEAEFNSSYGLTGQQKEQILFVFNYARATTVLPAADMKKLQWSDELAAMMQTVTDMCGYQYYNNLESLVSVTSSNTTGQGSLAVTTFTERYILYKDEARDPVGVAKWRTWRMAPFYDFSNDGCINSTASMKICRYPYLYSRVVTNGNEKIGCAMTICGTGPKDVFHACAAEGSGFLRSGKPWIIGERCLHCDTAAGWIYCDHGLCSKTPSLNGTASDWWPTRPPTRAPTSYPIKKPMVPTNYPTRRPTGAPTSYVSKKAIVRTNYPTRRPTRTRVPTTKRPTSRRPSKRPTA